MYIPKQGSAERHRTPVNVGFDGGGTKTHAVVTDLKGKFITEGFSRGSNPKKFGFKTAVTEIESSFVNACITENLDYQTLEIRSCVAGIAGLGDERAREYLLSELRKERIFLDTRLELTTDNKIALFGACGNGPGIVQIAGTGAITTGRNKEGKIYRADGCGVWGDRGSCSWLAKKGIEAVFQSFYDPTKATKLTELAFERFRVKNSADLYNRLEILGRDSHDVNEFVKDIAYAAWRTDKVAYGLLMKAADAITESITTTIRELKMENESFPIGFVGSLFKIGDLIKMPIFYGLREIAPKIRFKSGEVVPAKAAARMALKMFA